MVSVSEALDIDKILEYSGFDKSAQQTIVAADRFESYYDILTLGDSDIVNQAKGFSDRNVATGNISFGLRRTNFLQATIHWDHDFRTIIRTPSLIGISNATERCAAIEAARQRSRIWNYSLEKSDSLIKAVDPGKLKRHKDWITWSRVLKNYMSTILVQDVVPLIYVIRECVAPDYNI